MRSNHAASGAPDPAPAIALRGAVSGAVVLLVVAVLIAGGCIRPYRIDIQQGNVVTDAQLEQLKPGMSRKEARFLLGTPLIEDPFHADRWDYHYAYHGGRSKTREQATVSLHFEGDRLVRVSGGLEGESREARRWQTDEWPVAARGPANGAEPAAASAEAARESTAETGFFSRVWNRVVGRNE